MHLSSSYVLCSALIIKYPFLQILAYYVGQADDVANSSLIFFFYYLLNALQSQKLFYEFYKLMKVKHYLDRFPKI